MNILSGKVAVMVFTQKKTILWIKTSKIHFSIEGFWRKSFFYNCFIWKGLCGVGGSADPQKQFSFYSGFLYRQLKNLLLNLFKRETWLLWKRILMKEKISLDSIFQFGLLVFKILFWKSMMRWQQRTRGDLRCLWFFGIRTILVAWLEDALLTDWSP